MSLDGCLQVSSVRVAPQWNHRPFCSKDRISLPAGNGTGKNKYSISSSSSAPLRARFQKSSFLCKARKAIDEVGEVTDSSWESLVVGSRKPVLVEFWAPWCGPCRMIAPVIDELAKEYAGKIECYKLNTDDWPNIATQYGIRSIPTVLFFNNGEKKESVIGAVPKSTLAATIDKYLSA